MKTTSTTILLGMGAALGSALLLQAFSGLPLLFALAVVIGSVALAFGATVIALSLVSPARTPVSVRRRLRATV